MFGKKDKIKQSKKSIVESAKKKDDHLNVHVMPAKFLTGSIKRKKSQASLSSPGKSASGIKKNLIVGIAIVLVLGALMLVAAWLFLKSINQQPTSQQQPVVSVSQPGKLTTTPQLKPAPAASMPETSPGPTSTTLDLDQPVADLTPDVSSWTTYNDDQAFFKIKYPPDLEFKPLKFSESFRLTQPGRLLGIGRLNITELDYAHQKYKEAALRDRLALEEQGLFGEIFDLPFEGSQKVIKVSQKNIKIYTLLENEDQDIIFERRAIFYNGDYQIIIALKEDQDFITTKAADYFSGEAWNQEGQYIQSHFFNLLTGGNAQPQIQEWYDLFDHIISSLVVVEHKDVSKDQDVIQDVQPTLSKHAPPASQDTDKDKLTDVEEEIYSSSPDKPDTDQDGYLDGDEVINFYSPLKPGQTLESSRLIEAYPNTQYGYIIYYPSMWSQEELDSQGETVMFTSETTEFVEVIVQENMSGITSIRAWYLSQMAGIEPSQVANIIVDGLIGVQSPDGMNVYFMKNNLIYTISYNINLKQEANFMTTFEMMVKSFKLFDNPLDQ